MKSGSRQLKEAKTMQYYYNWDMFRRPHFDRFWKLGFPIKEVMDLGDVKHCSYSELEEITSTSINKYGRGDFIFRTMHGRLFHGRIKMDSSSLEDVIVKTWDYLARHHLICYHYHCRRRGLDLRPTRRSRPSIGRPIDDRKFCSRTAVHDIVPPPLAMPSRATPPLATTPLAMPHG
ncbi:hypothetical protein Salat_0079700 [Sesamum alatum]|uniref:Uncharacterized protein n=1 Tax=Sesamum alatum TaxID=300844 RepID=A0AAE1YX96_9LAMI|nr:hypothetical protein Salat_0079700 [Sesamum alatum]